MLDDVHDEGEETLTLALANPSSGRLTDAEATGTIKNRDPLPRALLARFGRTAAVHIVEQVEGTGGGAARAGVPGPVRGPGAAAGERIRPVAASTIRWPDRRFPAAGRRGSPAAARTRPVHARWAPWPRRWATVRHRAPLLVR